MNRVAQAGLVAAVLFSHGLLGQHGTTSVLAPHPAVAPRPSPRSFAVPPGPALANRNMQNQTPKIGRSGHWPSWEYGDQQNNQQDRGSGRYPYVYPGYLSFGYGLPFGYGYGGEDQATSNSALPQQAPVAGPPFPPDEELTENAPPYRPVYSGQGGSVAMPAPVIAAPVHEQPVTTLVFKDGRPHREVHNYALMGSSLWALDDDKRQEIPLALLDIPATVKANREAGVDFALPR